MITNLAYASKLKNEINKLAQEIRRPVRLMEVCGTHTEVIVKFGIREIMPQNMELVTGPGCPVCVTAQEDIDAVVELALADVPVYCYGDILRVPGTKMSLEQARAEGAQVEVVYSVEDVPVGDNVVFFGLGFETTAPMTASVIKRGATVYSAHKYFPPAMLALANDPKIQIDGFINPGHVSAIIGIAPYRDIQKPQVIAGFQPDDILQTIVMLLRQIKDEESRVENQYTRLVKPGGNKSAQSLLADVFEPAETNWRGLGMVPESGMKIRYKFRRFDAAHKYKDIISQASKARKIKGCRCGEVIKGQLKPQECSLFRKKCAPGNPVGACMVSREGACRIAYDND